MKQSIFSVADWITVFGAFLFGIVSFLSLNFYSLGNTSDSIMKAVGIGALLFGLAYGAKLLKRTDRYFKPCFVVEIILLISLIGLMAYFTYWPFSHYFVVWERKGDIKFKLNDNISQAAKMFEEYEEYAKNRESLYKNKLNTAVRNMNTNPGNLTKYGLVRNNVPLNAQIETKTKYLHNDLFPNNFQDTKNNALAHLTEAKNHSESWLFTNIVGDVNNLQKMSEGWLEYLTKLSHKREYGEEATDFSYSFSFVDVKNKFTVKGDVPLLAIVVDIVILCLLLCSWITTDRSSKSSICKPQKKSKNQGKYTIDYNSKSK